MNSNKKNLFYLAITFCIFSGNAFASDSSPVKGYFVNNSVKSPAENRIPVSDIGEGDQYQDYYDGMWTGLYTNLKVAGRFDVKQFEGGLTLGYDTQVGDLVYGIRAEGLMVLSKATAAASGSTTAGADGADAISKKDTKNSDEKYIVEIATRAGFSIEDGLYYGVGGLNFIDTNFKGFFVGAGLEKVISDNATVFAEYHYQFSEINTLSPHSATIGSGFRF
ncbi:outer membrane protein [Candidatus Liberibacter sp.]|uniref:outer membrane protein n=1 Tax=Candidatus Liberibacter sp. TaxID=34022 RepID=UPI0015F4D16C|nr:hypothetical protein [Candidatus Liberibacter sp.]MBA5724048.1 hypothetical protein [Candidatus Liberibacter sp.]